MAEKESKFTTTVESLFKGMDSFISATDRSRGCGPC